MKRRLTEPFGKAGLTVGIIALLMALVGGAYAAGGLTKPQEKQVKKIAKKEAQKYANSNPGAPGPAGAAGKDGTNGTNGTNGADGASVTGTPIASGGACGVGVTGVKYSLSGTDTPVCNGKEGAKGKQGDPWTAGGTLPPGETLTGVWGGTVNEETKAVKVAQQASFNIPLTAPPVVNLIQKDGTATTGDLSKCPGSPSNPQAAPGNFCAYAITPAEEPEGLGIGGGNTSALRALTTGVLFQANIPAFNPATFSVSAIGGTWAVTAPTS